MLKRAELDIKNGRKEEGKHAKIKTKMIRNLTSQHRSARVARKILQRKTNNSFCKELNFVHCFRASERLISKLSNLDLKKMNLEHYLGI